MLQAKTPIITCHTDANGRSYSPPESVMRHGERLSFSTGIPEPGRTAENSFANIYSSQRLGVSGKSLATWM